MNRRIFWIVLIALGLPVLLRVLWYFPGFVFPRAIATPDYTSMKMPEAPVSTPHAAEVKQAGGTVVIDYAHSNQFQLSEIQSLTDSLTQRGGHFVLNSDPTTLAGQLKSASSYVVISPSLPFTPAELSLVEGFVGRGGRLAVFTDATRGVLSYDFLGNPVANLPDVVAANPLLEPFGISVNSDYLYDLDHNEGNFRNVFMTISGKSVLTSGVARVAFYGVHSLETLSGSALLVGGGTTLSSSTDALPADQAEKGWPAAVISKDGNVLALGDFTFLSAPYDAVADNAVLISNIADFLLSSSRGIALADYPFLFRGSSVSLLPTSKVQMTAEITGGLSKLQAEFAATGVELKVVEQAPSKGDLIVLGTYSPTDDLDGYIKSFGLTADDLGDYIKIAPFGKIGQSGNGVLLFSPSETGNTLVLLAASTEDLTSLLESQATSYLSGCLVQGNVAACSVGFGGSFNETTPTPEATPTAVGSG